MTFNVFTPMGAVTQPQFEVDAEGFRVFPERADSEARQMFESFSSAVRQQKTGVALKAVSGAIAGGTTAGPVGAFIGGLLGAVSGYWQYKNYRSQAYAAYIAAGGEVSRRPRARRGVFYSRIDRDSYGWRYPYGELVADVIVDVLSKKRPELTTAELRAMGSESLRVFKDFRFAHPDIPLELAADLILARYGVVRAVGPGSPQVYDPEAAARITDPKPPDEPRPDEKKYDWVIYAVGGVIAVLLLTRR